MGCKGSKVRILSHRPRDRLKAFKERFLKAFFLGDPDAVILHIPGTEALTICVRFDLPPTSHRLQRVLHSHNPYAANRASRNRSVRWVQSLRGYSRHETLAKGWCNLFTVSTNSDASFESWPMLSPEICFSASHAVGYTRLQAGLAGRPLRRMIATLANSRPQDIIAQAWGSGTGAACR
jgi:hypothetical protein